MGPSKMSAGSAALDRNPGILGPLSFSVSACVRRPSSTLIRIRIIAPSQSTRPCTHSRPKTNTAIALSVDIARLHTSVCIFLPQHVSCDVSDSPTRPQWSSCQRDRLWRHGYALFCSHNPFSYHCTTGVGAYYGKTDEALALETLTYAANRGVTFWDTADVYGTSSCALL